MSRSNFVLGDADTSSGASQMFIHFNGEKAMRSMLNLAPGLWQWWYPRGIGVTKDGKVGGNGANASGLYRNFLLTPVVN